MANNILAISLDTSIVKGELSSSGLRQLQYSKYFDQYCIIVISTRRDRLKPEYHYDNLHIYPTNVFFKPYAILKGLQLVKKLHEEYGFSLITVQDPLATGMIGAMAKRLLNIPLNVQLHSSYHFQPGWEEESLSNQLWKYAISPVLKRADSIRAVNRGLVEKLKIAYPLIAKKIQHIPVMVELEYFRKRIKKKERFTKFLTVGRLAPEKNHLLLLEAFAKVVSLKPQAELTIVGDGVLKETLRQKIKDLGISKSVTLAGKADSENVRDFLHQSDVYVSSSNHEGWGNALVEAMAAGLPVIATRVGCFGDDWLGKDIAKLIKPNALVDLQEQMLWCLLNPDMALTMAAKAQAAVLDKLDKKRLEKQWIELLQKT